MRGPGGSSGAPRSRALQLWTVSQPGVTFPAEVAVDDGEVYAVSGNDGAVRAFGLASGAPHWSLIPTVPGQFTAARGFSAPAVAGPQVYAAVSLLPAGKNA